MLIGFYMAMPVYSIDVFRISQKTWFLDAPKLGELSHIVLSSPEAAREVKKTHDINFANRPFLLDAEIIMYHFSDIAFASYGGYWRQLRKVCTLELLSTKCVQSFRSEESSLSYSITIRTGFSGRCKQHEAFISILRKLVEAAAGFSIADLFPSIKLLHVISGMGAKFERDRNAHPKKSDDEIDDQVSALLNLQDHGGLEFPLTTDNVKAEMMKNPRILEKEQAEVRQAYDRTGDVSESDLHELTYLKLVIKETLRLHPPPPLLLPRETNSSVVQLTTKGLTSNLFPLVLEGESVLASQFTVWLFSRLPNGLENEDLDMTEAFGASVRRKSDMYLIPIPYHPLCVQ
ncbi:premnaspirodiene oxygenase [Gossypium hirsutum]|uniref:Premnaspirodiene oxygenase n=1 Tax=Gossypium hirsutum TaxID=3635 RepID=A0A1U8KI83_GOSHI|nr:premnaspirodiene oxygenase-like [Gossypium hirsutum]